LITRAIDSDNDWRFGNGSGNYLSEQDALMQNIKTRIQSFYGDCYFDLTAGIDWFNLLGAKSQAAIKNAIAVVILNTTGVQSIDSLELKLDENRQLAITYSVTSIYGTTTTTTTTV